MSKHTNENPRGLGNFNRKLTLLSVAGAFAFAAGAQAQSQESVTHTTASDGTDVTVHSGQPKPAQYGQPPAFGSLDANSDGFISRAEAEGYMPLFNDFDYLAHDANRISKLQFKRWVQTQTR
jgi:hypothetical protein